jgi:hypothetical protein
MKNYTLKITTLLFLLSNLSFADVFSYTLQGFPKQDTNCHQQAKSIADQFENTVQVKVVHVECTAETETGYDFLLEYEALQKLDFTATDYTFSGVYAKGRYSELKECDKNLPEQVAKFKKATQLNPMFSYCRHEGIGSSKPWEIIITAPGKSDLQPTLGGFLLFSQPKNITYTDIFNGLKNELSKKGAILSDLVFQSKFPMGEASIHYFSTDRFFFELSRLTKTMKLEQCLTQAEEVRSWFQSYSIPNFSIFCGGPDMGEFELNIGTVEPPSFTWKNSIEFFKSFEECEANKTNVLKNYSGSALQTILGGLCSRDVEDRKFHLQILRKKKPKKL